ncbi:MAG: hypothetical protein HY033_09020 [Ignavibacteriae bacterium]|nr:hypothetical protein [Ignavibacteria bacterium]MBI3365032.1 hypothetical protein [Ignavibacteriota bacterium]
MNNDKPICFVIQEYDDGGTFDRRYHETIAPALSKAGVEPKRADQILGLQPVVEKIEVAIQSAGICVAEVSTDNPNVWLELGYALALDRPTVILCDKSKRSRLPFDIQHRPVIFYRTDSRSGFDELESKLIVNVQSEIDRANRITRAPVLKGGATQLEDLKDFEVALLSTLLALWPTPRSGASHDELRQKLSSLEYNDVALGLGISRLLEKGYVTQKILHETDSWNNDYSIHVYQITLDGISWIQAHEDKIQIREVVKDSATTKDDLPF